MKVLLSSTILVRSSKTVEWPTATVSRTSKVPQPKTICDVIAASTLFWRLAHLSNVVLTEARNAVTKPSTRISSIEVEREVPVRLPRSVATELAQLVAQGREVGGGSPVIYASACFHSEKRIGLGSPIVELKVVVVVVVVREGPHVVLAERFDGSDELRPRIVTHFLIPKRRPFVLTLDGVE
ncbi:hypothetical protein PG984_015416 [Apiospora sp. TS-2023a]